MPAAQMAPARRADPNLQFLEPNILRAKAGPGTHPGETMIRSLRLSLALLLLAVPALAEPNAARKDAPTLRRTSTHARAQTARAARRARAKGHPAKAVAAPAPARAGMVIAYDPETGRLGPPTVEQLLALDARERNAVSRSLAGLIQVHHPDGSVSVDLQGRFQEFAVATIGADGKPVLRCVEDSASVRRPLSPAPAAPALEER